MREYIKIANELIQAYDTYMKKCIRVGIIFGGRSAEHEVSLESAKNIVGALDKKKYEVVLLPIDKNGEWEHGLPDFQKLDCIFPVLHGTYGEDGTMQGLLKLANIPFVGAGVLGSAVGMDKDVMKRLLRDASIPMAKFITVSSKEESSLLFKDVKKKLGLPMFVKPANLGSSIGIHKVKSEKDFASAVRDAFRYDSKIIIEEFIAGREIECSVLGNETPIASVPGEVIPHHEFYSYEAKYLDPDGAGLEIPARLTPKTIRTVQSLAVKTFKTLCLEGMARVDFFVKKDGEILINEVNTIPGFTNISMYPKLWMASGISQRKLVDTLITLAIERFEKEKKLKTSFR